MFSVLSSVDLFHENIKDTDAFVRSTSSKQTAKIFSKAYNLPDDVFSSTFKRNDSNQFVLAKKTLASLTKSNVTKSASGTTIQTPILDFGEAELFYDIFSTIFFYENLIKQNVFVTTFSDRAVGILTSPQEFPIITTNTNRSLVESVNFDTYSIAVDKNEITSL